MPFYEEVKLFEGYKQISRHKSLVEAKVIQAF